MKGRDRLTKEDEQQDDRMRSEKIEGRAGGR